MHYLEWFSIFSRYVTGACRRAEASGQNAKSGFVRKIETFFSRAEVRYHLFNPTVQANSNLHSQDAERYGSRKVTSPWKVNTVPLTVERKQLRETGGT